MIKIDDKLKLLLPVLDERKVKCLRQMYFFEDDYREKKEIENHIDMLISRLVKQDIEDEIILPPPDKGISAGDINIGKVEYLRKQLFDFKLKLSDINRHTGIFGSTGSGKTTFARNLILQLHQKKIPFMIFDWETSYRNLVKDLPDVQVFTVGKDIHPLFLNFLTVPPGISYEEYIKSLAAIIEEDYVGGIGSSTVLIETMDKAFRETNHPSFEDLKQMVLKLSKGQRRGRRGLWEESFLRQCTHLSYGAAGQVVGSRKHLPIDELFNKNVVLEFGNLKSPYDRRFFIHVIINWLSLWTQYHGIHNRKAA